MVTDQYIQQLEEENAALHKQLAEAQEAVDFYGAWWKKETNGSDVSYSLCLGNFCLAVIINPHPDEYRCHVIRLSDRSWHWGEKDKETTLERAKISCEMSLGFGKAMLETMNKYAKDINIHSTKWMASIRNDVRVDVPMTGIPEWAKRIVNGK